MMKIIGTHDERTIKQLQTCLDAEEGSEGVLCADGHLGYSMPIGGVIAYNNYISPSGVGYDIGCGNMAVKTNLLATDLKESDWKGFANEISDTISFGIGRSNKHRVGEHAVFDRINASPVREQRSLIQLAQSQLGTVGSGNHYVDLLTSASGHVWVANHFGSRGLGHKTATGFLNLAEGRGWDERSGQGEMESVPILLSLASPLGQDYLEAMKIAGEYAYAGREEVIKQVVTILGCEVLDSVHNHHNFAWAEGGKMVVRKGATPLFPNQRGFVGGSMGDICVVVRGKLDAPQDALYSAMHGAGRVMSRRQAAGKSRIRKMWGCGNRDCNYTAQASAFRRGVLGELPKCPTCNTKMRLSQRKELISSGVVKWDEVRQALANKGIVLIGAGADEAPEVYRPLQDVLDAHKDYLDVEEVLVPKVVLMAGEDVFDPFKD